MQKFVPIDLLNQRVEIAKEDSDASMFLHLMYSAEQLAKLIIVGLLACVGDDSLRHRYAQEYRLVRADGIGEWSKALDEILSGPTSQFLFGEIRDFQKDLLEQTKEGSWQYDSVNFLNDCLKTIDPKTDRLPIKTQGRNWFTIFTRLRNKTRGHGAIGGNDFSDICVLLEKSISLQFQNLSILNLPWAYLKRNLNGKYKVSSISLNTEVFEPLKSDRRQNYVDGIYLYAGEPKKVNLLFSTSALEDFYFPNGAFGKNTFECISYITDNKVYQDVSLFITPAGSLPKSQTEGLGSLELRGNSFTNIPINPIVYIQRDDLEKELIQIMMDDRHPVVTLVGRGGIGKTSLAISVLQKLCSEEKFSAIIWLSARDIDLLVQGAKPVKPNVLTIVDIAKEFCSLLEIKIEKGGPNEKDLMEGELAKSDFGPILFVFDNFETVVNPREVYVWLNTFIRLPNKILITSRFRDFKGDYPIEVHGMNEKEFRALVENVAIEIGIPEIKDDHQYVQDLFTQSDGHPYVAKILMGERLKQKGSGNIKIVLASKDDILTALFERTYNYLSPMARRVFLTVSNWRSIIPEVALEAVLLRSHTEPIDVEEAIEELYKSSLIETIKSSGDDSYFISVPFSAAIFGKKKLSVDPLKAAIEADTILLQSFGAGTVDDVKLGLKPRVEKLFSEVAKRISNTKIPLENYIPILEFICAKYHDSWILLSELYEEEDNIPEAIRAIQKYLESPTLNKDALSGWQRLARLYRLEKNWQAEVNALVEYCLVPDIPFSELSNSANMINRLLNENKTAVDSLEKSISIQKVTKVFENRIYKDKYSDSDDYSRLAWLFLHLNEEKKAKEVVELGLKINPNNVYCQKLYERLNHFF
jgi:tetratricopeptide (TPR) repeat protein